MAVADNGKDEQPNGIVPVCPHCGADPVTISSATINFGPLKTLAFFCGNKLCRKLFGIEALGFEQPKVSPFTQVPPRIT